MNTETKFATLFIALVTVVPLLYSGIPGIRGSWAIAGFAPALWCFWMGVVIDECRKVKLGCKGCRCRRGYRADNCFLLRRLR